MGMTRTYHQAPEGFRSAKEIGAHVLKFLLQAAQQESEIPVSRTIVTVPASFLFARETEYRMTSSIFAPLTDALNRAVLTPEDIAVCLMAGSSSFIPKIQQELDQFFTGGFVLNFATPEDAKLAISRGAAYHAMALHLTGTGLVKPITADAVLLQTNDGPIEIVPAATGLPYPGSDAWSTVSALKVPLFPANQPRILKEDEVWEWEIENPFVNIEYPCSIWLSPSDAAASCAKPKPTLRQRWPAIVKPHTSCSAP